MSLAIAFRVTGADAVGVGGVASSGIAEVVRGSRRPVRVLAAFPAAVYLEHDDGLLSLVAADGVAHPNSVALARRLDRSLATFRPGSSGEVGELSVRLSGLEVRVTRWFDPRPRLRPTDPDVLAARAAAATRMAVAQVGPTPGALADRLAVLVASLRGGHGDAAIRAADRLLGLGPGLTPAGDDALAGLFAATPAFVAALPADGAAAPMRGVALTDRVARVAEHVVGRAPAATTAVSAALLRHAARGEVAGPAATVLRALTGPHRDHADADLAAAVRALLAVGSTSGRDLLLGLLAAADLASSAAASAAAAHLVVRATAPTGGRA